MPWPILVWCPLRQAVWSGFAPLWCGVADLSAGLGVRETPGRGATRYRAVAVVNLSPIGTLGGKFGSLGGINPGNPLTRLVSTGTSLLFAFACKGEPVEDNRVGLVLMLLREGSTRQAIEVFQEEAAVNFSAARQSVLALAEEHGIPLRRRRIAMPLTLLAIALALVGWALANPV